MWLTAFSLRENRGLIDKDDDIVYIHVYDLKWDQSNMASWEILLKWSTVSGKIIEPKRDCPLPYLMTSRECVSPEFRPSRFPIFQFSSDGVQLPKKVADFYGLW